MSVVDLSVYEMARPGSLEAICELVAERQVRGLPSVLLAGGTDWMVEREMARPLPPGAALPLVIDLGSAAELRDIELDGDRLRIGAAATYLAIQRSDVVRRRAPLLERMTHDIGAIQIQARGTLGGNLATASPAADGAAALAAYDARVIVRSVRGERAIAFADLQTGYKQSSRAPDEVIVAVEIDLPPEESTWAWRKVGTRRAQAISKVAFAALACVEDGRVTRVGFGMASVAPVTAILPAARARCLGQPLREISGEEIDLAVSADVSPIDDVRSTRAYRLHCAKAVVRQFVADLVARSADRRPADDA